MNADVALGFLLGVTTSFLLGMTVLALIDHTAWRHRKAARKARTR